MLGRILLNSNKNVVINSLKYHIVRIIPAIIRRTIVVYISFNFKLFLFQQTSNAMGGLMNGSSRSGDLNNNMSGSSPAPFVPPPHLKPLGLSASSWDYRVWDVAHPYAKYQNWAPDYKTEVTEQCKSSSKVQVSNIDKFRWTRKLWTYRNRYLKVFIIVVLCTKSKVNAKL